VRAKISYAEQAAGVHMCEREGRMREAVGGAVVNRFDGGMLNPAHPFLKKTCCHSHEEIRRHR